ncbi:oxidoreductase [Arachidicoccus ginsenosidimutans]|uniref:Gfo/Idh/MocA family protein n=1 Tax=Arachidicoccus sp. BS20 TaxID=1850526 RepID=UPI0007F13335|nr:Gfo/Idh/MocA family oxidoreductase [Arachidicoccus sp. BS20]ANI89829.1 oxidoreductase [Arachidicoccus sp. BS20]
MNFSIIGFGHIGKIHKAAIEQTANARLISVVEHLALQENDVLHYASLDDFLQKDSETEIVCIATPNGLHAQQAIQCLNAGKHVIVEKPLALNTKDAEEMLRVAQVNNRRVFSFLQLRFSPAVNFVKRLIDNHHLGKIYLLNIQCYWNRNEAYYKSREWHGSRAMDGGVLFTQFSHFIDAINYWFGEAKCISSRTFNFNHSFTEFSDSGIVDFSANNVAGSFTFTTSTFNKNFESGIIIIAEKGTIKIGDQYLNQIKYADLAENISLENISTEQKNFHSEAIADVIDSLQNHAASVLDGSNALPLIRFIESVEQS